jgi:hypothetical protein
LDGGLRHCFQRCSCKPRSSLPHEFPCHSKLEIIYWLQAGSSKFLKLRIYFWPGYLYKTFPGLTWLK